MTHLQIDQRSLAFGRVIAEKLRRDPSLVRVAKQNLDRWFLTCSPRAAPALTEWEQILGSSVDAVIETLTATDERSTRLRQSNPFAGVLTPRERNDLLRRFYSDEPLST